MPLPLLRTDRILLRPWILDDVDALHALWMEPEIRRFPWDDVLITREVAVEVVQSVVETADRHSVGCWSLYIPPSTVKEHACIAGFCGFRLIEEGPDVELLYGLRGEHWGQGLATEACGAILEHFWRATSYDQVYARTDPPNRKSIEVMLRLGMKHVSTTDAMITYVLTRPQETL